MSELKNHNWLYIEPYVHIEISNQRVLFFNTLNGSSLEYDEKDCYEIAKNIIKKENLRVVEISKDLFSKEPVKLMLKSIIKNHIGDLIAINSEKNKPVQLVPILKIEEYRADQRDINNEKIERNISAFVNELSIYINNDHNYLNDSFYRIAYKQSLSVKKNINDYCELSFEQIKKCYNDFSVHNLTKINFLGGNIFDHSEFEQILSYFNNKKIIKNYYFDVNDFDLNKIGILNELDNYSTFYVIFHDLTINKNITDFIVNTKQFTNIHYMFFAHSEACLENIEMLYNKYLFESYSLYPYYNEKNKEFISSAISFNKNDVFKSGILMKDILLREKINESFFGNFFIMEDGLIYSNLNLDPVGSIYSNTILEMIYNEVNITRGWFYLRKNAKNCEDCLYKNICPPISALEIFLNKYNFCIN